MNRYLLAALLLPILYFAYATVRSLVTRYQNARRAKELGCQPAALRPYKYPGGIDMILRVIDADKRHQIPNEFEKIYHEMGTPTWLQYFFGHPTFLTADPKNIQALLATQFNDFEIGPTRRGNFFPLFGNGIFTTDGKAWEHARAMLRPQFARDQVGDLDLDERHVQDMFRHLKADHSGWTPEVNLQPLFFRLTLDTATEFLFGQSVHSQISALPDSAAGKHQIDVGIDLDLAEVGKAFDRGTHALGKRGRLAEHYWLHNPQTFVDDCKLVHKFADYYVNLALEKPVDAPDQHDTDKKKRYVFLEELVKATRDPVELRSQLLNIFLAGRDTTAGLLGWTFWNLARHPDVFEKLRDVVIDMFGTYENPKDITFASLKSCTYLQHVMNEVLRLFPSVPVNSRRAVKPTTIPRGGGPDGNAPVFIPRHAQVDYSVHIMHRRTDLWGPDALEFKPERWQGRKVGWEFLPFNGGPRICLGQQFSLTEAGYVIVRMLQRYDGIQNLDTIPENDPKHQYTVTTAPYAVPVRLHEASATG